MNDGTNDWRYFSLCFFLITDHNLVQVKGMYPCLRWPFELKEIVDEENMRPQGDYGREILVIKFFLHSAYLLTLFLEHDASISEVVYKI